MESEVLQNFAPCNATGSNGTHTDWRMSCSAQCAASDDEFFHSFASLLCCTCVYIWSVFNRLALTMVGDGDDEHAGCWCSWGTPARIAYEAKKKKNVRFVRM